MERKAGLDDTLQNRLSALSVTHQVPTAAGRLFQHHQAYLVLLPENHVPDILALGLVVAVHIVEEVAADALRPSYLAVYVPQVVGQL